MKYGSMFVQGVFWTEELFHGITSELLLLSLQSKIFCNQILMKKLRNIFSWLYPGMLLYNFLYCPPYPPKGGSHFSSCRLYMWGMKSASREPGDCWLSNQRGNWWVDPDHGSAWHEDSDVTFSFGHAPSSEEDYYSLCCFLPHFLWFSG